MRKLPQVETVEFRKSEYEQQNCDIDKIQAYVHDKFLTENPKRKRKNMGMTKNYINFHLNEGIDGIGPP